jgi:hypothetical protein
MTKGLSVISNAAVFTSSLSVALQAGIANDFPPRAHNGNMKNGIPPLPAQSVRDVPGLYPSGR